MIVKESLRNHVILAFTSYINILLKFVCLSVTWRDINAIKNHEKRRKKWKDAVKDAFKWRNRDQYWVDADRTEYQYEKAVRKILN